MTSKWRRCNPSCEGRLLLFLAVLLRVLMGSHTDRPQVTRMEIVDTGRRRRWSETEKRRIVEESFSGRRLVSATARAHGISRSLLTTWRKQHREGRLGLEEMPSFAPVLVTPEPLADVATLASPRAAVGSHRDRADKWASDHRRRGNRYGRAGAGGVGPGAGMIALPPRVRVWLAGGATDMRKGMNGLAVLVQEGLKRDPHAGDLFVFRGRRGQLIKLLWHDGVGMSLYVKRLDHGRFIWPTPADGAVAVSAAQLGYLLEGIDWRNPRHTWRPSAAG
jgi:transposase